MSDIFIIITCCFQKVNIIIYISSDVNINITMSTIYTISSLPDSATSTYMKREKKK